MRAYGLSDYYSIDSSDCSAYRRKCDWDMAKGLQTVDGLETSEYLEILQAEHIEGRITAAEVSAIVADYYERKPDLAVSRGAEADLVAARIVEVIEAGGFSMSPAFLKQVHGRLFAGIIEPPYDSAYRDFNVGKSEPILAGDSVSYSDYHDFDSQLSYEFDRIRRQGAVDVSIPGVKGLSKFIDFVSGVWQIHPFAEGNTRTVATFAVVCLRSFGFELDNTPFLENSLYFRNALVRANYCNYPLGVQPTLKPLEMFFSNALFGTDYPLRNRELYVDELYENKGLPLPSAAFADHMDHRIEDAKARATALNNQRTQTSQPGKGHGEPEL